MEFNAEFFWHSLRAAGFAMVFFGIPGLWTALMLGFRVNLSLLCFVPVLGLCVYGPFSLLFTWLVGYSSITVGIAWISFQVVSVRIAYGSRQKKTGYETDDQQHQAPNPNPNLYFF